MKKPTTQPTRPNCERGFSLVVTLALMILLAIIAVGLLSLSSISLRTAQAGSADAIAKANARFALQIALGELQKSAGPDRRVTASAEIRGGANAEKSKWTGVWNTEKWKPGTPTSNKTFVSWIASDPALRAVSLPADLERQVDGVLSGVNTKSRKVSLVSSGTLGAGATAAKGKVEMYTTPMVNAAGMTGAYAYWVGDEGVKARYDLGDKGLPNDLAKNARWGAPARSGIQKIAGMEVYKDLTDEVLLKTTSYQGMELAQGATLPPDLFHHVTTDSVGLPVDVRLGGPKQDLSLAFEQPLAEFNALSSYHFDRETNNTAWYNQLNSGVYNKPEFYPSSHQLGYLCLIPRDGTSDRVRGPTWDLLRNHYRLYKREWEVFTWPRKLTVSNDAVEARGSLPFSYASSINGTSIGGRFSEFSGESMLYGKSMKNNWSYPLKRRERPSNSSFDPVLDPLRRTSERISPLVTRVTFVFGVVRGMVPYWDNDQKIFVKKDTVAISMDPYITIINPYNKPLEFHSFGFYSSKFNPFVFQLEYTPMNGAPTSAVFNSSDNVYNRGSISFRLNPATAGGKMRMEPGEVRVISPEEVRDGIQVDRSSATPLSGTALYNEDSGILVPPNSPVNPKPGTSVGVTIFGRNFNESPTELGVLNFSLFYPKLHGGQARNVVTDLPPKGDIQVDVDAIDDPQVMRLGFSTHAFTSSSRLQAKRTLSDVQIPMVNNPGQFVGAFDMWMKDFRSSDVSALAQFNPRASVQDPRDYDGTHRVGPSWEAQMLPITDISVLNLVTASGLGRLGGGQGREVRLSLICACMTYPQHL